MTEVVNLKNLDYSGPEDLPGLYVYIGRSSNGNGHILNRDPYKKGWLGNPYTLHNHSREESIEKYRELFHRKLENDDEFREAVHNLENNKLVCFCKPDPCHGDVIVEYLENRAEKGDTSG